MEPGDVVALLLPSSIDFAVGYAAASRLGAVATGVNTRLGPNEITAILDKCDARGTDPRVGGRPGACRRDSGRAS